MRWRPDSAAPRWRRDDGLRAAALAAAVVLNLVGWMLLGRSAPPAPTAAPTAVPTIVRLLPMAVEPPARYGPRQESSAAAPERDPRLRHSRRSPRTPDIAAPAITIPPAVAVTATAATPAAPTASAAPAASAAEPPLDLGAGVLREAARRSRGGARAMAEAAGRPLADDTPGAAAAMAEGVRRAARADCRSAHTDKGLLAAPMVLWDTLRDRGCRW